MKLILSHQNQKLEAFNSGRSRGWLEATAGTVALVMTGNRAGWHLVRSGVSWTAVAGFWVTFAVFVGVTEFLRRAYRVAAQREAAREGGNG